MKEILKKARKEYPKGSQFYTTTGQVIVPLTVNELRIAENYENTIINESGGIIYNKDENGVETWAEKVN